MMETMDKLEKLQNEMDDIHERLMRADKALGDLRRIHGETLSLLHDIRGESTKVVQDLKDISKRQRSSLMFFSTQRDELQVEYMAKCDEWWTVSADDDIKMEEIK